MAINDSSRPANTMPASDTSEYWQGLAQRWHRLGPPLRPCTEDVENFRRLMGSDPGRCLLLGVTPELAGLANDMTAIDNSAAMIEALWKPLADVKPAILGDWLDLPFEDASFDTIIGDGCLVLLSHPGQYERFFEQLSRVISPGGRILLRVFVGAEQGESREQVCHAALNGEMKGFHAFKWRLSMAIASEADDRNLCVAETLATFDRLIPDRNKLEAATGWSMDDIETIDFYRDSKTLYCYPALSQVRRIIPYGLRETGIIYGHYELAERCPLMVIETG